MPEFSPNVVVAFATFLRRRLAEVGGTVRDTVSAPLAPLRREPAVAPQRRNIAMVIVAAAAPFAPTSHARARLLRQAHASGLLSASETEDALSEMRAIGAPRS